MHRRNRPVSLITDNNVRRFVIAVMVFWSAAVGASLAWQVHEERLQIIGLARNEASAYLMKDIAFRHWAAGHGGVYVPITERTQPTPALSHIPERDIETPSGKKLTLLNPAYMVRQLIEEHPVAFGVKGRIVSRNPFRMQNLPDQWETEALDAFDEGDSERFEIIIVNGIEHARLMLPFVAKAMCLDCHETKGFIEGKVGGGLGVTFPITSYLALEAKAVRNYAVAHAGIWAVGIAGILIASRRLRLAHERVLSSLREKDVLLKELHHRVKNNLAVVSALQGLESSRTKNPEVLRVLGESQSRIRSIALVHEKLYRGADLSTINSKEYVEGLATELIRTLGIGRITLDIKAEPLDLDIDTLIPCGLILNELLTNTARHAFDAAKRGEVRISLSQRESTVYLEVSDNGRGFDVAATREGGSLGLKIVDTLAAQIEGTAEITSSPKGTRCVVSFPYPEETGP
jgi:two-component sensor histidine kinase